MTKIERFVDCTKYPVYQAWMVTSKISGEPLYQMMILKEKYFPYQYYIVHFKNHKGWFFEPGKEFWEKSDNSDFFVRKLHFEMDRSSYLVEQIFGPKMGNEFPNHDDAWRIIEKLQVCDNVLMPIFLYICYEDCDGQIKRGIAYPGAEKFTDAWDKNFSWERRMVFEPPIDGSIKFRWEKKPTCLRMRRTPPTGKLDFRGQPEYMK